MNRQDTFVFGLLAGLFIASWFLLFPFQLEAEKGMSLAFLVVVSIIVLVLMNRLLARLRDKLLARIRKRYSNKFLGFIDRDAY